MHPQPHQPLPLLAIDRSPATKPLVNLAELNLVLTAFRRGWRPGTCGTTLLAGIVATGSVSGLDLSQEADYAAPVLLARGPHNADAPGYLQLA